MSTPGLREGELFIVDYDLPMGVARKRFYRRLKRYREKHDIGYSKSSLSVIKTTSWEYAKFVWKQAREVGGKANIYLAKPVPPPREG